MNVPEQDYWKTWALSREPYPTLLVARWEEIFYEVHRLCWSRPTHPPASVNQMKRIRNMLDLEIDSAERKNG